LVNDIPGREGSVRSGKTIHGTMDKRVKIDSTAESREVELCRDAPRNSASLFSAVNNLKS
jgi:hypothetical protein